MAKFEEVREERGKRGEREERENREKKEEIEERGEEKEERGREKGKGRTKVVKIFFPYLTLSSFVHPVTAKVRTFVDGK